MFLLEGEVFLSEGEVLLPRYPCNTCTLLNLGKRGREGGTEGGKGHQAGEAEAEAREPEEVTEEEDYGGVKAARESFRWYLRCVCVCVWGGGGGECISGLFCTCKLF